MTLTIVRASVGIGTIEGPLLDEESAVELAKVIAAGKTIIELMTRLFNPLTTKLLAIDATIVSGNPEKGII
jgi:hypothetical protein